MLPWLYSLIIPILNVLALELPCITFLNRVSCCLLMSCPVFQFQRQPTVGRLWDFSVHQGPISEVHLYFYLVFNQSIVYTDYYYCLLIILKMVHKEYTATRYTWSLVITIEKSSIVSIDIGNFWQRIL